MEGKKKGWKKEGETGENRQGYGSESGRGWQTEEAECVLTGNRIIDVPSGDRLPPCCLFYLLFLLPPSSSSLPFIEISHPFPPFLVPIDTLVIDSAAQPSGKLNKRNLITGWESLSRYYFGESFFFFSLSLFRRAISQWVEQIVRIDYEDFAKRNSPVRALD